MENHNTRTVIMRYLRRAAAGALALGVLLAGPAARAQSYFNPSGIRSNTGNTGNAYNQQQTGYGSGYGGSGGGYGSGYGGSGSGYGNSGSGNRLGSGFGNSGSGGGFGSSFGNSGSGGGFGSGSGSFGNSSSAFGSGFGNNNQNYGSSDYQSQSGSGRSRSRRDRNQSQYGQTGQNGQQNIPQGARVQGKSNVVTRKGKAAPKAGGGQATALPPIKVDPKLMQDALFMAPSFMNVAPGDRFMTTISYYNSSRHDLNGYDIWLHYNPALMEPIWADTHQTLPYAAGEIESHVWPQRGYIQLRAKLTKTPKGQIVEFADLHWRAKTAALGARIELAAPAGSTVAVFQGKANLVSGNNQRNGQKVNADINIIPLDWDEPGLRTAEQADKLVPLPPMGKMDRLRLAIVSPQAEVATGQVAVADVVLLNPKGLSFDSLKMCIRYDPAEVTILDADQDNFIADGLNIFDGDFHDKFPFDGQIRNQVDPERGTIEYEVGSVMGPKVFPSGVFARIVYRMNSLAGKASFLFQAEDPLLKIRTTDVTAYGTSMLGTNTAIALDALHGAEIAVMPLDLTPERKKASTTAMARK